MKNQTFRTASIFKRKIKHALNKGDIRDFCDIIRNNALCIEINNHANGAKTIFNVNMSNIAYPYHIGRFSHKFLLNPVPINLILAIGG